MVPIRLQAAKTRLSTRPAPLRETLMVAMALDVIAAVRACPHISDIRIIGDDRAHELLIDTADRPDAVTFLKDPGDGLNGALTAGSRGISGPVAALLADLPCLTADLLTRVLTAWPDQRAIVSDAEGIGTTMLMASSGQLLRPHFGPRSRAAHISDGAVDIADRFPGEFAGLRRDVDSEVGLWDAQRIGLGPHTASLLASPSR